MRSLAAAIPIASTLADRTKVPAIRARRTVIVAQMIVSRSGDNPLVDGRISMGFSVSIQRAIRPLALTIERLQQRQQRLGRYHVLPISTADHEAVLALHLYLPATSADAKRRLLHPGHCDGYQQDRSYVLAIDGVTSGLFLTQATSEHSTAFIYGLVVEPTARRTPASIVLRYRALRELNNAGVRTISYQVRSESSDTQRFSKRIGAVLTEC